MFVARCALCSLFFGFRAVWFSLFVRLGEDLNNNEQKTTSKKQRAKYKQQRANNKKNKIPYL